MAPLVIDSTDPKTVKASLERYSGKPIINSVNFEDGGTKLYKMLDTAYNSEGAPKEWYENHIVRGTTVYHSQENM